MASPFKTHETMDLARLLQEEDSLNERRTAEREREKRENFSRDGDLPTFTNLVVTKDSSTELIPTHTTTHTNENKPAFMLRDLNAGRGLVDDDGKPVVGKVFSRVINISGSDSKPKQLKARRSRKEECTASCCRKDSRDRPSARPQSSGTNDLASRGANSTSFCPSCNRQFSIESLKHHVNFCRSSPKQS